MNDIYDIRLAEYQPWASLVVCLLIGALVGAQREISSTKTVIGLRDFMLVSGMGFVMGWINQPVLIATTAAIIAAITIAQRFRDTSHVGLTTDLSVMAVYFITVLASARPYPGSISIAITLAIALTLVLVVKGQVKKFFRETVTDLEFADTVRFLALVIAIYPVLPQGEYGPFGFFAPSRFWLFIVLASSISYIGYFFEKFLGVRRGLFITSVVGGLASTTVSTNAFAHVVRKDGNRLQEAWRAVTIANSIQYPRVLSLLFAVGPTVATALMIPFAAAMAAGFVVALLIRPKNNGATVESMFEAGNPFSLMPALKFAVVVTAIIFVTKVAQSWYGNGAFLITAGFGGLVDTDSIAFAASNLVEHQPTDTSIGAIAVIIAFVTNAIFKTTLAVSNGSWAFGWRVAISFAAMLGAAITTYALTQ